MEHGQVALTEADVRRLGEVLALGGVVVDRLVEHVRLIGKQPIDDELISDYESSYTVHQLPEIEARARSIKVINVAIIDGLLQTPDYMAALYRSLVSQGVDEDLFVEVGEDDYRVARAHRQAALLDGRKSLTFLLCEAALRRQVGSVAVMIDQYRHLLDVHRHENITIGVVPLRSSRPVAQGDIEIVDDVLVLTEALTHCMVTRLPAKVRVYLRTFDQFSGVALFGQDVESLLGGLLDETLRRSSDMGSGDSRIA